MSELISAVRVTPVAFRDLPLLNSVGVHEPFALRTIVEIVTGSGLYGLGETYGDEPHLRRIERAGTALIGTDIFDLHEIRRRVAVSLDHDDQAGGHGMAGMVTTSSTTDRVLSPFEVAALDLQGKIVGRPVSDLLGGAVRDRVSFTGYLFYKWAAHPGHDEDGWGAALDPGGIVRQATKMIHEYGFSSLKLKGGVFPPDQEVAAIQALRQAFPHTPLRLDPNAVWTVPTSIKVGLQLDGVLEYLEDPAAGIPEMAAVAREVPMPLATDMCVVAFDHLKPAVRQQAVGVVLADHHFWGGLRRSQSLAAICDTFGLGLSMHSNSHLGISLAAMVHLAAATPNLDYTCDTHWPWKDPEDDVIVPGAIGFENGAVKVPVKPGLGVELDRDALARLHQQYLDSGIRNRDDTGYMRRVNPDWKAPRW
ncbi:glucarate dehydratase [Kineosporia sp. J2-2]|uniref:glucarate dehydratase n=1 Tax=Kineosporia corallincola TaxID=2835133 RepID=A0ABS5TR72_9ACTN|nr:glucarate dehydratase family protein [Kineosporia corallincola]MBT0772779.1 glucarate dehydratase [Kineosporia corallincola]